MTSYLGRLPPSLTLTLRFFLHPSHLPHSYVRSRLNNVHFRSTILHDQGWDFFTLGLMKYCALPTYSGQENANLHPDSPNPASQIPRLLFNVPRQNRQTRETRFQRRRSLRHNTIDPPIIILHEATKARSKQRQPSGMVGPFGSLARSCHLRLHFIGDVSFFTAFVFSNLKDCHQREC